MDPKVTELKDEGNAAMKVQNYQEAIDFYSQAVELDPANEVLYSNRSGAYASRCQYDMALKDAEKAVELKPNWPKGHSRKATALNFLKRYADAVAAYEEALKYDPENQQLKSELAKCQNELNGGTRRAPSAGAGPGGFLNMFSDPNLMDRLRQDPRTRSYVDQPDFQQIIRNMQANPQSLMQYMGDPRISQALSVLLGIDLTTMAGGADDDQMDTDENPRSAEPERPPPPPTSTTSSSTKKADPRARTKDLTAEQSKAWDEKDLGNECYKKKDFDNALKHYDTAIELDPQNITHQTNKAAVLFEQGKYQECIELCVKAVETGRENRADFAVIAKALARIGNSHFKLGDLKNAKTYLEKSLAEHRSDDTLKKVKEIENLLKEQERKAYINPEMAEEAKNKGNELFKQGDFPGALKHYSEAIKRNQTDAKLYSNRAACYTKLLEFNLGLKDCEECVKLDPTFVKGYIRKGTILTAMKQQSKATQAFEKALELEPESSEARDGLYKAQIETARDPDAARKQAMEDPEVQSIISDPAMRMILEQMQKEPQAVREHLKNPEVARKIQKLVEAGLVGMR